MDQKFFIAYTGGFVQEAEVNKQFNWRSIHYTANTLAGYMKLKWVLKHYHTDTGNSVDYDVYTMDYYNAFKLWLTDRGRGLTLNYVGTLLKDLKVMLE